jgi:hypothetical protein
LNVFLRLDGKEEPPIQIEPADGFQAEMDFLREQVEEAERRIRDYLFQTTNIVAYQNIKGENMIIRLHWTEKIADGVRNILRR